MTGRAITIRPVRSGKGCWYFHSVTVCVLCGAKMREYRERRWTQKPENPHERFEYIEDAHQGHFL